MVQGVVVARMAVTEGWANDLPELLRCGDSVRVDPASKTITVL